MSWLLGPCKSSWILLFSHLVGDLSLGRGLAPAGDVGAVKDPENIHNHNLSTVCIIIMELWF